MLISVIITAHNRQQYLERAINSVVNQTLRRSEYEIILIKNFLDKRIDKFASDNGIKSILSEKDSTIGEDLFQGITNSTGSILTFLDDDDIYARNRLEKISEIFTNNNIKYCKNEVYFQDDGDKLIKITKRLELHEDYFIKSEDAAKKSALMNYVKADFNSSSISIRKEIISDKIMNYLNNKLTVSPDTFLLCIALSSGGGIYLSSERLTGYRMNQSLSKYDSKDVNTFEKQLIFWDHLIQTYKDFKIFFNERSTPFLENRICSQTLAIEIAKAKKRLTKSKNVSLMHCFLRGIKTRDITLIYDSVRYVKSRLLHA